VTSSADAEFTPTLLLGGQDRVPRLGYGAMQLAGPGVLGLPDDVPGAIAVLRAAADQGVRFFDTANAYGPRTVNQLIGRALSPFADDMVIGNKVGASRDAAGGWLIDSRPETVRTQVEDALLDLRAEVLAACERNGIAFVPYFPLATGFLGEPGALTRPAQRLGVSTSAVALAWLLRRSPVIVPIPGTKSLAHLRDNLGATRVAAQLTGDEVRALTAVADEEFATLTAMPGEMAAALGRRRAASAGRLLCCSSGDCRALSVVILTMWSACRS
jgi:aryl-alcohol dehydrogenase-like predicted oxidoreductase